MSSSDRARPALRRAAAAAMLMALAAAAGCTVRPLYGDVTSATAAQGLPAARLASVEIKPATDRVGQEVRNHLIFLLGAGQGQPANPAYMLDLRTTVAKLSATEINTGRVALAPTSGVMTVRSTFRLTDAETGAVAAAGTRAAQAAFDIPAQSFAALRAEREAQNRAAREVAEQLRLAIGQELEKQTSTTVPTVLSGPEELQERLERSPFGSARQPSRNDPASQYDPG